MSLNLIPGIRRRLIAAAAVALCGAAAAVVAVPTTPASASPAVFTKAIITEPLPFWLNLDVSGASKSNGAGVIAWWANGNTNQQWQFEAVRTDGTGIIYRIRNVNSQKCLTTSGIAGNQLYQYSCFADDLYQEWGTDMGPGWDGREHNLVNPAFNLCVDVYGYSAVPGAKIDSYYCNGQVNQLFY